MVDAKQNTVTDAGSNPVLTTKQDDAPVVTA